MLAMETEMKTQRVACGGGGFTLTELLVVICVVAVVAVLLLPGLAASKRKNEKINCINNLKQIGLASRIWEGDNGDKYPMQSALTNDAMIKLISDGKAYVLWQTMSNVLGTPKNLVCPADKQRTAAVSFTQNFSDANISYFISLDASDAYPQMILFGDDNLAVNGVRVRPGILNLWTNTPFSWTKERHGGAGNIGLSDGSIQTTTSTALQAAVQSVQQGFQPTATSANGLLIP